MNTQFLNTSGNPADPAEMEPELRLAIHQQRAGGQDDESLNKLHQIKTNKRTLGTHRTRTRRIEKDPNEKRSQKKAGDRTRTNKTNEKRRDKQRQNNTTREETTQNKWEFDKSRNLETNKSKDGTTQE